MKNLKAIVVVGVVFVSAIARAADYSCVPTRVEVSETSVVVQCASPSIDRTGFDAPFYPFDGVVQISSFGLSFAPGDAFARYMIRLSDIGMTSGILITFRYDSGATDTGCTNANACRRPNAVLLTAFGRVPAL